MDSSFQIINEYEILKKILLNLNCKELLIASQVCQNWKRVADIIFQKNIEISCCLKIGKKWAELNPRINPKLILYNKDSDLRNKDMISVVSERLKKHYDTKDSYLIFLSNFKFINTIKEGRKLAIYHSFNEQTCCNDKHKKNYNKFRESLVLIPEFSNLKIESETFLPMIKNHEKDKTIEKVVQSKCCLIFTNSSDQENLEIIKYLCEAAEKRGSELVMAGGITHFMMSSHGGGKNLIVPGAVVTFSGECLTAKSFIIPYKADLTSSFAMMAEALGTLEAGYERLAFIFTCVDRYSIHEEEETEEFAQFFPDVSLYGFWSLGEFCMGFSNASYKRKKSSSDHYTSSGKQFFYQQASTYLFITFKK